MPLFFRRLGMFYDNIINCFINKYVLPWNLYNNFLINIEWELNIFSLFFSYEILYNFFSDFVFIFFHIVTKK